jgi:hypothetical protein
MKPASTELGAVHNPRIPERTAKVQPVVERIVQLLMDSSGFVDRHVNQAVASTMRCSR